MICYTQPRIYSVYTYVCISKHACEIVQWMYVQLCSLACTSRAIAWWDASPPHLRISYKQECAQDPVVTWQVAHSWWNTRQIGWTDWKAIGRTGHIRGCIRLLLHESRAHQAAHALALAPSKLHLSVPLHSARPALCARSLARSSSQASSRFHQTPMQGCLHTVANFHAGKQQQ